MREWLIDGRGVDDCGDAYRLAGGRDVFAIEEGAGPVFNGIVVWDFWVPVTLAAVEGDTTACCHRATSYSLAATEEAVFEVIYCRRYT